MTQRIGIDLGGTKIEGVVMSHEREILRRERVATPRAYPDIVRAVAELVTALRQTAPDASVGIGTPGASNAAGLLYNSNTVCLNGRPLRADVEAALGGPVRMINDANCLALSEATDGAAAGVEVVFGVILGTGVGGGVVVRGHVLSGPHGIAGEWGHNPLDLTGPECYCGRRGCVETYLSGPGFAADFRRAGGADLTPPTIVAAARAGDDLAQACLARYLERFGRALAVVINILDPTSSSWAAAYPTSTNSMWKAPRRCAATSSIPTGAAASSKTVGAIRRACAARRGCGMRREA